MTLLGETGLRRLAALNHANARASSPSGWPAMPGVELLNDSFFNEFTLRLPSRRAAGRSRRWPTKGVLGGVPLGAALSGRRALDELLLVASPRPNTDEDIDALRRRARRRCCA